MTTDDITTAHDACRARVAASLRRYDNHDPRLPYYQLMLEGPTDPVPDCPLPAGCGLAFYRPGDEKDWIDIEKSARELTDTAQGLEVWQRYYGGREAELKDRLLFITAPDGRKVATATAYYDIRRPDDGVNGMLHWVAVRREAQGKGLSKPLVAAAVRRMRALGYRRVVIPTQTTTWLACKVYLDLGFRPIPQNAVNSRRGWEIVRTLTDHPALSGFDTVEL